MDRETWYANYWKGKAFTYLSEAEYISEEGPHKKVFFEAVDKIVAQKKTTKLRILDVGCWTGNLLHIFEQKYPGVQLYGVDLSERAVAFAKKKYTVRVCDLEKQKLPFKDGSFDLVVSTNVLEHLFNVDNYMREIHRVLKKGGTFVGTTPNSGDLMSRVALLMGRPPYWLSIEHSYEHIRFLNVRTMNYLFKKYRFKKQFIWGDFVIVNLANMLTFKIHALRKVTPDLCSIMVFAAEK